MRLTPSLVLAALGVLLCIPGRLAADLVWTPQEGWKVEGGVLSSLNGPEGRNAVDLMNKARNAEEAHKERTALKFYGQVTKKYPNSIFAPEAYFRVGALREDRHEYYKAFDAYQQLLARYPNSEKFIQVIGEQYKIATALFQGKRNRLWGWFPGFRNREKALEYYQQIVANAPYSDYAPLSLMNAARGYKQINETDAAIDTLDRMINTYPRNVLTPDAYLKIAQTHASLVDGPQYDQASTKNAITYYEDYMILFPGDAGMASAEKGLDQMKKVLARSKFVIADYYFKYRQNYKAAKVFYNEAITVYPDSDVAAEARKKLVVVEAKLTEQEERMKNQPPPKPKIKKPSKHWIF